MKRINRILIGGISSIGLVLAGCNADATEKENAEAQQEIVEPEAASEQKDGQTSEQSERYYFTANEGGTISKINAADHTVVATIEADGVVHNVQVSNDGKILAATLVPATGGHGATHGEVEDDGHTEDQEAGHDDVHDEGHADGANGSALFYDIETNELLKTVEVGSHPAHIVFTEDGKYVLVTNNEDDTVSVIEMETYAVVNTIVTGKGPHGFRISNDSEFAYIANMNEDTVSVVNLETMTEEKKITVGSAPVTTGVTTDGKTLVTTLNAENALAIVSLETDEVEKVEVGVGPAQVYIDSSDNFAYVVNQGTEDAPSNTMTIVDLKEKTVAATIETGNGAHGVVTSADNQYAYVTNMFDDTVSVIDLTEKKVIETVEVGAIPNGISIMD